MMSRIVINSEFGSLSIRTQGAKIEYQPSRYELNMEGNAEPSISLKTTPAQMDIDQSGSFASAGLKKSLQQNSEFATVSLQKGMEQIGQIAQEGLQFLRIERGGNPIASQAQQAMKHKEVQVVAKAVEPPETEYTPGKVELDAPPRTLSTDWQYVEGSKEYTPAEVVITLGVKPSIEIMVEPGVELRFPMAMGMGINVDEAI